VRRRERSLGFHNFITLESLLLRQALACVGERAENALLLLLLRVFLN
jgi:hypothetical protein